MTDIKLTPKMVTAMSTAQVDDDGKLCVGWGLPGSPGVFPGYPTMNALQRRGLIIETGQLTEAGENWFNANVTE